MRRYFLRVASRVVGVRVSRSGHQLQRLRLALAKAPRLNAQHFLRASKLVDGPYKVAVF